MKRISGWSEVLKYWLAWTLTAGAAYGLAAYLSRVLYQGVFFGRGTGVPEGSFLFQAYIPPSYRSTAAVLGLAFFSLLIRYGALGLVQWAYLRELLGVSWRWIPATLAGAVLLDLPGAYLNARIYSGDFQELFRTQFMGVNALHLGGTLLTAAAVSLLQWTVLRKRLSGSVWWILTAAAAAAVYVLVISPALPYYAWRDALLFGIPGRVLGVPAVGWLASSLVQALYQLWMQAALGLALVAVLWKPWEQVQRERLPV